MAEKGRETRDGAMRDAYTILVTEYDVMAAQLERLADEAREAQLG